jgi:hypothetical protein
MAIVVSLEVQTMGAPGTARPAALRASAASVVALSGLSE